MFFSDLKSCAYKIRPPLPLPSRFPFPFGKFILLRVSFSHIIFGNPRGTLHFPQICIGGRFSVLQDILAIVLEILKLPPVSLSTLAGNPVSAY